MKRTIRRRSITSALSAALVVTGLFAVAGVSSMGAVTPAADVVVDPEPFVERESFGTLELHTDPDGGLAVALTIDGVTEYHDLSLARQDKCEVDRGSTSPLLADFLHLEVVEASFTGTDLSTEPYETAPAIGLVDNGLGSREQNNCNRSNGRLEPGQAFVIELGSDPRFDDVVFDHGVLDVEGKFGADLYAETTLNDTSVLAYEDMLGNASDNDADSAGNDNNRPEIGTIPATGVDSLGPDTDDFDRLVLVPVARTVDESDETTGYWFDRGELALEGGGDFGVEASAYRTIFHLVTSKTYEYSLVCYVDGSDVDNPNADGTIEYIAESPTDLDWNIDIDDLADSGYPAGTRLFRYAGVDDEGELKPCPAIGADLSADTTGADVDSVLLEPSTDTAFLRVEVTWVVPWPSSTSPSPDPFARQIDVDGDGPGAPEAAQYCASFNGDPWSYLNPGMPVHPTDASGDEIPWCVLVDDRTLGEITVLVEGEPTTIPVVFQRMIWDGLGDPKWL